MTTARRLCAVVLSVCVGSACTGGSIADTGGATTTTLTSAGGAETSLPTPSSASTTEAAPTGAGEDATTTSTTSTGGAATSGLASSGAGEAGTTGAADPAPAGTTGATGATEGATEAMRPRPGEGEGDGMAPPDGATDEDLLVALVGDQGAGADTKAVYALMVAEAADMVILLGDFDYEDDPALWASEMNEVLGDDFPVFGVIGNHDVDAWSGYRAVLEQRLQDTPGAACEGELGVAASCTYRGLHFVLSGLGVEGSDADHEAHIAGALAADASLWSLCAVHKNMRDLQAGDKPDDLTWAALQTCQDAGAIVAMAHEHSYARTRTLTAIGDAAAGHGAVGDPGLLAVGPGSTFSVCSGLGGKSIRGYEDLHDDDTWWATLYTADRYVENGEEVDDFTADHGVLFIRFHVDGDPAAARGYFKNIAGETIDEFDVLHL